MAFNQFHGGQSEIKWLVDEKSSSHKRFDKKKNFSKFLSKHQKK
jgi:hypothetical protein